MHPFRAAIEAWDFDRVPDVLAPDVVFYSPVVFKAYEGRDVVAVILRAVSQVFTEFRYESEMASEDGRNHALVFRAQVGDREVEGCDFLTTGDDGLVTQLTVMVRPLSAAHALRDAMAAKLAEFGA